MERARPVDLDRLAGQLVQLASSQQLTIVPAMPLPNPGCGMLVLLDSDVMSAAEFCVLAAVGGARLLYVDTERFEHWTEVVLEGGPPPGTPGPARSGLAALRRESAAYNGRVRELELAFACGCVLHCWAATADWYADLIQRVDDLLHPPDPEPRNGSH